MNGIVGIKPTVGLISRAGIIPISHIQDTAGPMARTVRDAALLLGALAGEDPNDRATSAARGKVQPDYTRFLNASGLDCARLGIVRRFFEGNAPIDRFLSGCVDDLKHAGAEIVDPVDLPSASELDVPVLSYEFKAGVNAYLAKLDNGSKPRNLKELIAFNENNRALEMPYFDQEIFIRSEKQGPLSDERYTKARADSLRYAREEGIDAAIQKHKLDAIVSITSGPAG